MSDAAGIKFGPVRFERGVQAKNGWGLLYASFVTIGLATGIAVMTPYVLTTGLGIGQGDQGKALGTLAVVQELALLVAYAMFGALADKIGRRAVYGIGMLLLAVAYFAFAYGNTMLELAVYRMIYAFGIGAATGMLATVIADYTVSEDRGKMTALCGFLNGLGVVIVALFLGKLPTYFVGLGQSEVEAGRSAMAVVAGVAFVSALVLWLTLRPGTPDNADSKKSVRALLAEGIGAARENRRLALCYASAFVARGDLAIVGLFTIAWGNLAAIDQGMSNADAVDAGNLPFIIAQSTALLWPAVIAVPLDRLHRLRALAMTMALGCVGYCLLVLVDDPLSTAAIPFFVMLGVGQISAFLGAQTVIGKEAPERTRGSVIGLFNFCGALGILVLTAIGGWLFDHVGPWAPFFLVGILNGAIAVLCLLQLASERRTELPV